MNVRNAECHSGRSFEIHWLRLFSFSAECGSNRFAVDLFILWRIYLILLFNITTRQIKSMNVIRNPNKWGKWLFGKKFIMRCIFMPLIFGSYFLASVIMQWKRKQIWELIKSNWMTGMISTEYNWKSTLFACYHYFFHSTLHSSLFLYSLIIVAWVLSMYVNYSRHTSYWNTSVIFRLVATSRRHHWVKIAQNTTNLS